MSNELFSFSKLTTFHTCPYSYYLTYIKENPRKQNVYGYLGGKVHWLLEELQQEKINNQRAIELFEEAMDDCDVLGLNFPTENSKNNFRECIIEYLKVYEPLKSVQYYIEDYFEENIEGVTVRGYIDLYVIDGDYIDIYDYKSSSKFTAKDLETKKLQLIIYAIALRKKYPNLKIRNLYFDMLKYTKNKRGTLIERNKSEEQEKRGYVKVKFDENGVNSAKDFIKNTFNEIKELNPLVEFEWKANVNKFFCQNICSNYKECKKGVFF